MNFLQETIFFNNSLLYWGYFFIALIVTFFLSSIIAKIIIKILKKASTKTENKFDVLIVNSIESPLYLLTKVIGIMFSFNIIKLPLSLELIANNIFYTLITFAIFKALHSSIEFIAYSFTHITNKLGKKLSNEVISFLAKGLKILIIILGTMAILQKWGMNVNGFVASLGLGGLAFALAAKDTAANLFGSLVIFIDKPFLIGDWIKTPEVEGTIVDIGIRSTKVRTFAQAIVTVPNANLANAAIINWSRMGKRRIKTNLGLTYNTTPEQMNAILKDLNAYLIANTDIDSETIFINFSGFGTSTLDIFCYFFTKTTNWGEYMKIKEEIFLEFMRIITTRHKAQFAFPSQSLYLEKGSLN